MLFYVQGDELRLWRSSSTPSLERMPGELFTHRHPLCMKRPGPDGKESLRHTLPTAATPSQPRPAAEPTHLVAEAAEATVQGAAAQKPEAAPPFEDVALEAAAVAGTPAESAVAGDR